MRVAADVQSSARALLTLFLRTALERRDEDEEDALTTERRIWCPSERAAWARARATLQLRTPGSAPRYGTPACAAALRGLVMQCLRTPGAPRRLVVVGATTRAFAVDGAVRRRAEATPLPGERAVWLLRLDLLTMEHATLASILLFANAPGSIVIAPTRDAFALAAVAARCGFAPAFAVRLPPDVALVLQRVQPGRFVRGSGRRSLVERARVGGGSPRSPPRGDDSPSSSGDL